MLKNEENIRLTFGGSQCDWSSDLKSVVEDGLQKETSPLRVPLRVAGGSHRHREEQEEGRQEEAQEEEGNEMHEGCHVGGFREGELTFGLLRG